MPESTSNNNPNNDPDDFLVMQNMCEQIGKIHSELSKMNLADKMAYIMSKQVELNS